MRVKLKILNTLAPASDGSRISARVIEEYLQSDTYKEGINNRTNLGSLTHRCRNIAAGVKDLNPGISKVIGKDDTLLTISEGIAPTHYLESLELGSDGWLYGWAKILPEDLMDDEGKQLVRRLTALLKSGVKVPCSAVVLAFWSSEGTQGDEAKKLVNIKSVDFTLNPSWQNAGTTEIYDDDNKRIDTENQKLYSEAGVKDESLVTVKLFSDLSSIKGNLPKTSKVDGKFTTLKAKVFSSCCVMSEEDGGNVTPVIEQEKSYSAATLRERVRYANPDKYSPRMRVRRLFIEYKQVIKQMGGVDKMDETTKNTLRSLLLADMNMIMGEITKDIKAGKQIATLIGASSLGATIRKAAQELQIPYRLAFVELEKTGRISPMRFTKIKEAYTKFLNMFCDEVFKSTTPSAFGKKETVEAEENQEEDNK